MARRFAVASLLVVLAALARPAVATQVRSLNLETMTAHADRIFSGRVERVRVLTDETLGRTVTEVTFAVERAVKGPRDPQATVRFVGDRSGKRSPDGIGLPDFREGEEVVLFLYGDSRLGLTSPVGFLQGKFRVYVDKQGRRRAVNALGNRGLHAHMSRDAVRRLGATATGAPAPERAADPDELLDNVERLMD